MLLPMTRERVFITILSLFFSRLTTAIASKSSSMFVAVRLLAAGLGTLTLIIEELRNAPEGYEDEHGFHMLRVAA
jgi:hypothetical protein